jgi:hypothetical protein
VAAVSGEREVTAAPATADVPRPSWRECLLWVGLAMTASTLLLAMTRHLTQDVAPVPFLWVLPLACTCSASSSASTRRATTCGRCSSPRCRFAFFGLDRIKTRAWRCRWMVALISPSLFVFCMVCHGELVRRKPPPRHLTLFYLMLSLGGALGGMFVGLLAPAIFTAYFELPIGLFLCALLVTVVLWRDLRRHWRILLLRGACRLRLAASVVRLHRVRRELPRHVVRNFYSQLRVSER